MESVQLEDAGTLQLEDAGTLQLEDGGTLQLEDGGTPLDISCLKRTPADDVLNEELLLRARYGDVEAQLQANTNPKSHP